MSQRNPLLAFQFTPVPTEFVSAFQVLLEAFEFFHAPINASEQKLRFRLIVLQPIREFQPRQSAVMIAFAQIQARANQSEFRNERLGSPRCGGQQQKKSNSATKPAPAAARRFLLARRCLSGCHCIRHVSYHKDCPGQIRQPNSDDFNNSAFEAKRPGTCPVDGIEQETREETENTLLPLFTPVLQRIKVSAACVH
ncbi:MAG: hypothetical protein IID45_00010 [Planctomycetes bacterium]|nr:hypothetical protein [Planctomycetota bacterium]